MNDFKFFFYLNQLKISNLIVILMRTCIKVINYWLKINIAQKKFLKKERSRKLNIV